MPLRDQHEPPEGYETWQPRMGRGGKLIAWGVLLVIFAGTALMLWQALRLWL